MSTTLHRVQRIVVDHLCVSPDKVVGEANFIHDLGADSLDNIELIMAFEEEFSIEIPDHVADNVVTVGDAVKAIDEKLAA